MYKIQREHWMNTISVEEGWEASSMSAITARSNLSYSLEMWQKELSKFELFSFFTVRSKFSKATFKTHLNKIRDLIGNF